MVWNILGFRRTVRCRFLKLPVLSLLVYVVVTEISHVTHQRSIRYYYCTKIFRSDAMLPHSALLILASIKIAYCSKRYHHRKLQDRLLIDNTATFSSPHNNVLGTAEVPRYKNTDVSSRMASITTLQSRFFYDCSWPKSYTENKGCATR